MEIILKLSFNDLKKEAWSKEVDKIRLEDLKAQVFTEAVIADEVYLVTENGSYTLKRRV